MWQSISCVRCQSTMLTPVGPPLLHCITSPKPKIPVYSCELNLFCFSNRGLWFRLRPDFFYTKYTMAWSEGTTGFSKNLCIHHRVNSHRGRLIICRHFMWYYSHTSSRFVKPQSVNLPDLYKCIYFTISTNSNVTVRRQLHSYSSVMYTVTQWQMTLHLHG